MGMRKSLAVLAMLVAGLAALAGRARAGEIVVDGIRWPEFLSRHDLIWNGLPEKWTAAAFLGNGQLGALVYGTEDGRSLRWHIGRSDVVFRNSRIPIGDLILKPVGAIQSCSMRLDLWNATARGALRTDQGEIQWQSFTHAEQMAQVIEVRPSGAEAGCTFEWVGWPPVDPKIAAAMKDEVNPPVLAADEGAVQVRVQPHAGEGEHATAWTVVPGREGSRVVYLSVGYCTTGTADRAEAAGAVRKAAATGFEQLEASHHEWWHKYWPASFLSIPDPRLESFYWIQMYKLASATRADRPALDLLGPWYQRTPFGKIWWDQNIQLAYGPAPAANRLELGESLCRLLEKNAETLAQNARQFSGDSAYIGRRSGYDCVAPLGSEFCNLPWALHGFWLQYRHSMDDVRLRRTLFPLLKRGITYYLHQLEPGADGTLHIKGGYSPEYPGQPADNRDCNVDLALLRWGCRTLLEICERLKLDDPLMKQWQDVLAQLAPYPADRNGLMISAKAPLAESHRQYSHLLMVYPLYVLDPEQAENRPLITRSFEHWASMKEAWQGCSWTGAASLSAALGRGGDAAMYLNRLLDTRICPNTMCSEAGPALETPLSAAQSLHDMLLTSWGGTIRVFPAVPAVWRDAVIHNLRAEGAFLVSAVRKDGKTQWVRVKSLAGEPCRIKPALDGDAKVWLAGKNLEPDQEDDGAYELNLVKGDEAIFYAGPLVPTCEVTALPADAEACNYYGLRTSQPKK